MKIIKYRKLLKVTEAVTKKQPNKCARPHKSRKRLRWKANIKNRKIEKKGGINDNRLDDQKRM